MTADPVGSFPSVENNQCFMFHFIMPHLPCHRSKLLPNTILPQHVIFPDDLIRPVSLDRHINVSDLGYVYGGSAWGSGVVRKLRHDP